MARGVLSKRDTAALSELAQQLRVFSDGAPDLWAAWLPRFRELLDVPKYVFYELEPIDTGFEFINGVVADQQHAFEFAMQRMREVIRTGGRRFGHYDAMLPEPSQRNRTVMMQPMREQVARGQVPGDPRMLDVLTAAKAEGEYQFRALVCDDEGHFLAYVGGFSAGPLSVRTSTLLNKLVAPLRQRLLMERQLKTAPGHRLLLHAAIEEVPGPAWILGPRGNVEIANAHGLSLLDKSPRELRSQLREVISWGPHSGYRAMPVRAGNTSYHLIVGPRPSPLHERLPTAVKMWALTPKQSAVLECIIRGDANKIIATRLNCSTHTVELHVAAIFQKAGVESRAELTANFWMHL